MAVTFFQTYKEIQDKLSSIIRGEFRGYSVYFDDNYMNWKPSYFNITKTKDQLKSVEAQIHNALENHREKTLSAQLDLTR